jgi:hypothetical protein
MRPLELPEACANEPSTVRTCRSDIKGEVSSGQNREDESTEGQHGGKAL